MRGTGCSLQAAVACRCLLPAWCLLAAWCLLPAPLPAQLYLNSGHIDLNVAFSAEKAGGEPALFGLSAHHVSTLSGGATVDEPIDHTVFFVPDSGGKFPSAGGILPFLGKTGQPVWLIPSNNPPASIPWVGMGGYGLASSGLDALDPIPELTGNDTVPAVRVRFKGAITPAGADFALWQTGSGGTPVLYFSNRPDTGAPQQFGLRSGQHIHFNWGFSLPGYYRLRLQLEGSLDGVPVAAREVTVDFVIGELPLYEQWRRTGSRFTDLERATRIVGGPLADPDGDGRPNLLEYACATEPRVADKPTAANSATLHLIPDPAKPALATPGLAFTRLADPLLVYRVETSPDLASWSETWSSTRENNQAGWVTVPGTAPLSATAPRSFFRLRIGLVE